MRRVEKYQRRAIELRELAGAMKNQQARLSLLQLAASYDSLAVNLKEFYEGPKPELMSSAGIEKPSAPPR